MHEDRNGQDRKSRIPVIGLTGGIGTGKSTVAEYLKKGNYAHVDADQIGRDLTADGSELLPVLDQVFGPAGELGEPGKPILREDGSLDRKALGAIAFSAQEKKEKLDEIMLKHIIEEVDRQVAAYQAAECGELVIPGIGRESSLQRSRSRGSLSMRRCFLKQGLRTGATGSF